MLELPIPVVDVGHAHAVFDDQFSHANAAALSFPEAHWRQLEGPFLAGQPFGTILLRKKVTCTNKLMLQGVVCLHKSMSNLDC